MGSADLQPIGRRRVVHADGARVRADAATLAGGHRAHGEAAGAVRADAREPRPGAGAQDPRRDRRQAERGRAQPRRRDDRAAVGPVGRRRPQAPGRRHRRLEEGRRRAAAVARQDVGAERQGRFPHRTTAVRRKARVRAELATVARRDPPARRGCDQAHPRRDVRHRAQAAVGAAGFHQYRRARVDAGAARRCAAAGRDRSGTGAGLRRPPRARQGGRTGPAVHGAGHRVRA